MPASAAPATARCTASILPADVDALLRMAAAQSLFDTYARAALGMLLVDRSHRIVWISDGYRERFLPALGHAEADFVGRRVEEVVPNTLMAQVVQNGQPMLVDLLTNPAGTFLVSRLPLRDAAGEVMGAMGVVLLDHPETTMQPLMAKFGRLQRELDAARRQLADHRTRERRTKYTIASFIGSSAQAMETKRHARRIAQTDASTVLLLGETGTGKELLAHGIHAAGARAARPFVGVNIAAVPDTLLEAEFFGVAPGAYTGAERRGRDGKFRLADGGTLFLDEIGDMPLALQAKLLRVLQEQEVEPVGSDTVQRVDVRVIAATSRDLGAMVAAGSFRADLYWRLNVLPIRLPPLRERPGDIEALAEALLEDIARRSGLAVKTVAADALDLLCAHAWPGNIRELRNLLEQASLMTDDAVLEARHFAATILPPGPPAAVAVATADAAATVPSADIALPTPGAALPLPPAAEAASLPAVAGVPPAATTLPAAIAALEVQAIAEALAATGGNKLAAARRLGISRATLYEKLALYAGRLAGLAASAAPAAR